MNDSMKSALIFPAMEHQAHSPDTYCNSLAVTGGAGAQMASITVPCFKY